MNNSRLDLSLKLFSPSTSFSIAALPYVVYLAGLPFQKQSVSQEILP